MHATAKERENEHAYDADGGYAGYDDSFSLRVNSNNDNSPLVEVMNIVRSFVWLEPKRLRATMIKFVG